MIFQGGGGGSGPPVPPSGSALVAACFTRIDIQFAQKKNALKWIAVSLDYVTIRHFFYVREAGRASQDIKPLYMRNP